MVAGVMKQIYLFLLLLFGVGVAVAQPRAEKIGPFPGQASDHVKAALQKEGYRVYLPNTLVGCEVWLAAKVPAAKNTAQGVSYPELGDSAFLGVITFPKGGGGDFRGQSVRPGSYTMRYAVLPNDGNHLGVAPYPDFVLLIPIAEDVDPAVKIDLEKLVELSAKAARTQHPAAFEMMPPEGGEPSVTQTDDGWVVFHAAVAGADGKAIAIALVVKGSAAQ
jgi:hypothetical protein